MAYIQVNTNGFVYVISDSQTVPDGDNIFEVDKYDFSLLGKRRLADGTFEDVSRPDKLLQKGSIHDQNV